MSAAHVIPSVPRPRPRLVAVEGEATLVDVPVPSVPPPLPPRSARRPKVASLAEITSVEEEAPDLRAPSAQAIARAGMLARTTLFFVLYAIRAAARWCIVTMLPATVKGMGKQWARASLRVRTRS